MRIAIIILNWNGKEDTLECLASVEKLRYAPFDVTVVDNGSSDGSAAAVRQAFPWVCVIEAQTNLGFAEGNNVGIRAALSGGAEACFLLNNDTVVDPEILSAFAAAAARHLDTGIFGSYNYLYTERGTLDHLGGTWNRRKGAFDLAGLRQKGELPPPALDYVCGCGLFVKKEVFERAGLLDPRFFLLWEEADFCFRAKRAGFATRTCPEAKLWHKVSASFIGGKPHTAYFWWRNRFLWAERNCTRREWLSLCARVLFPELCHLGKMWAIKACQLRVLRLLRPNACVRQRAEKIAKYRASVRGIMDYLLRRFGNGPAWLYAKEGFEAAKRRRSRSS
jgi:GT2 family glycosyltransferase